MNKHYIRTDKKNRVIAGLTDDTIAYPDGVQDGDFFTHESGGRIFELYADNQWFANPPLMTADGIPLYLLDDDNAVVHRRRDEDIEADRAKIPPPPPLSPSHESWPGTIYTQKECADFLEEWMRQSGYVPDREVGDE